MTRPDIVRDAQSLLATDDAVNRYDMMKRTRLPMAVQWTELEWRDHPLSMAARIVITNGRVALWLLLTFCLSSLLVAPVARHFGAGLFSPVTYPLISFVCALAAYARFARTASFTEAAWRFFLPQALFIYLECAFSPGVDPRWTIVPVALAVLAVGYLADQVNTHYVWWITANLKLKKEAIARRREDWSMRFRWIALTGEIRELEETIAALEHEGRNDEAFEYRRRSGQLRELREYPLGFAVLLYFAALLFLGASTTMLLAAAFVFAAVLAVRRPIVTMKLSRLICEVIIHAFVSWFSWDPKQNWVNTPGLFQDRLASRFRRLTQTVGCFVLLEIAFIPSIHLWGTGEALTAAWLWTFQYEFFLNLLLAPLMLGCSLIATGARPLWLQVEAIEWADVSEDFHRRGVWDAAVGRIQSSKNSLERGHVLLGFHAEYGYPVLVPTRVLNEHMHILGDSGSGKTSRVLAPLIAQLIRAGGSGILIIDLKGDRALFESVRLGAEQHGRTFKHFTNVLGKSSYTFNPVLQVNSKTTSIAQFVETLMEALRLNHGDGYGSRFFTSQTRSWLLKTVKRFPNIATFEELLSKATPEFFKNEAEMDRCREAISVIQQIAEVTALNWKPNAGESDLPAREAIFMPDVVRLGHIVYVSIPAIGETSTVKEVGNLFLYALLTAQKAYKDAGGTKQTYLVIDEVQQMASDGFKLILRQARSFGLSMCLANQSESDLISRSTNRLLDTIKANTQVKVYLTATDPLTIKTLEKSSGLIAYSGMNGKLDYRPRLTVNDIAHYSGHSDYCICWITRDSGFSAYGGNWFGMRTCFHIDRAEFERRDNAPWPAPTPATIVAERTIEGNTTFVQGRATPAQAGLFGSETEEAPPLVVPEGSKWAVRLNAIYDRRFGRKGEAHVV